MSTPSHGRLELWSGSSSGGGANNTRTTDHACIIRRRPARRAFNSTAERSVEAATTTAAAPPPASARPAPDSLEPGAPASRQPSSPHTAAVSPARSWPRSFRDRCRPPRPAAYYTTARKLIIYARLQPSLIWSSRGRRRRVSAAAAPPPMRAGGHDAVDIMNYERSSGRVRSKLAPR